MFFDYDYSSFLFSCKVQVDHGVGYILMPQKVLHRADVISVFQQVRGKTVSESMAAHRLVNSGQVDRTLDRLMERRLVKMMPALFSRTWIDRETGGREGILPAPLTGCTRVFAGKRKRKEYLATTIFKVFSMQ